jgi:diguanylate cyclase (GGDEF)-like protein
MTANNISSSHYDLSVRGSPIRRHILGGVLLITAIAVGTAIMVSNLRERALNSSKRELENTVLLLARQFDQQFADFEIVQKNLVELLLTGVASPEDFKQQMSAPGTHLMLKGKVNATSYFGGVNVFDAEGALINSSQTWPIPSASVAERTFFKAFKTDPRSPVVSVESLQGGIIGTWTTVIAHKLIGTNGEFLGVVGRGMEVDHFEKFFASVALGKDAVISMLHRDGTMLARYPHVEAMIGRNLSTGQLFQTILPKSQHGTMRLVSPVDGEDRLASVRQLSDFPIVIIATATVSAALADWRDQTRLLIGVVGVLVFGIAVMLFLIVRQLSRQHKQLSVAVNNMAQSLLMFDSSDHLIICNQRYIEMFGLSPDVVKPGCSFRNLVAHRKETGSFSGDVDEYCSRVLRDTALGDVTHSIAETPDGRWMQIVNQPLSDGGWVTTLEDITERRRSDERIAHLAHYDALTGLPNRVLFQEQLEGALARIYPGEQLALLYIDIDEFKRVNDSLGHRIGDELLKSVAASLGSCLEKTDFIARLGGDEFAVVQTSVKCPEDVTGLATRLYQSIRGPHECLGHLVTTDISIGIALASQDGVDLEQLLKNADLAMYSAKAAGRRTYRFFEAEMDAHMKARHALETDLRQAIIEGGFEVYYQPIVDLQSNQISGCEALLRWCHPQRGMISPAEFIPVAEETGLINQLGEWVLTTACAEAATWPDNIKLAVNVSPVQFRSDTFALKVVAALAASGLSAGRLELEITEAVLIRDDEAALAMLHQFRALGVRIALDDFGTGYSSLSYLQRFPFDKIKIDRCFIKDIAESDEAPCIVQAVVNIATTCHITTTAEGVETEQQRDLLRKLGCTEMQGYFFSPAKPAADIRRLLLSRRDRVA